MNNNKMTPETFSDNLSADNNAKFNEIENLITKFQNINPSMNLFDNYNHRTWRIQLKVSLLWKDFEIAKGRTKEDAYCSSLGLSNIEIKTRNNKDNLLDNKKLFKEKYMFDKQDRSGRREYILKIDGLVLSVFYKEKLYWIFWTNDENTIKEYRDLCKKKQKDFVPEFEKNQKNLDHNGGYDTITISLDEFSDNSKWNFYFENNIYKDVLLEDIKSFLKIN